MAYTEYTIELMGGRVTRTTSHAWVAENAAAAGSRVTARVVADTEDGGGQGGA